MANPPRPSWLHLLVGAVSWPVVEVAFRHRATGVEHVPREGGFVLAANHWSNFDPWRLAMPFFPRRFFRFMAKSELGPLRVAYGPPIDMGDLAALPAGDAARIATDRLAGAVSRLEREAV